MADGEGQGGGDDALMTTSVLIGADLSRLDGDLDALPARVSKRLEATERAIRAQMARNRLAMKGAAGGGYALADDQAKVGAENARLSAQLDRVAESARRKTQALQAMNDRLAATRIQEASAASSTATLAEVSARAAAQQQALASRSVMAHSALGQAGGAARMNAMGFLLLSQAVEDAQYGISGVVNNLPGLVLAFGGSGGLAGAVSLAAIGINQLVKHWDEIAGLWRSEETQKEADRMKRLAEATAEATKEQERLQKAYAGRSVDEAKDRVEAATKEIGFDQAAKDLRRMMDKAGKRFTGREGGRLFDAEGPRLRNADGRGGATLDEAKDLLARAANGEAAALGAIEALSRNFPSAFSDAFRKTAREQEENTPEAKEEQESNDRRREARADNEAKKEKAREDRNKKWAADRKEKAGEYARDFGDRFGVEATRVAAGGSRDHLESRVRAALEKAGLDKTLDRQVVDELAKQARGRLAQRQLSEGVDPRTAAVRETLDARKRADELPPDRRRAAEAVIKDAGAAFRAAAAQPDYNDADLVEGLVTRLKKAGVLAEEAEQLAADAVAIRRRDDEDAIRGKILSGEAPDRDSAAKLVRKEAEDDEAKQRGKWAQLAKPEVLSGIDEFLNRLQTAGVKDESNDLLAEQKKATEQLKTIAENTGKPVRTVFGRRGG